MTPPSPRTEPRRVLRWYRLGLRFFPERIRTVHGAEMEEMFLDAWSDARRRGLRATGALILRTLFDLGYNGIAARGEERTMGDWIEDLGHAVRGLARRPGFALVAVSTLALGVGGTTAIYAIVDAAYVDALPYPDDHELAVLYNVPAPERGGGFAALSAPFYAAIRDEGVFEAVTDIVPQSVNVGGDERPERVPGARVSAPFFDVAGVLPAVGRAFTEDEDRPGGPDVAVISHGLWSRRYGADPGAVGGTMVVDGSPVTVVGVMPPGFGLLFDGVDVWLPVRLDPAAFTRTSARNNNRLVVARAAGSLDATAPRLPAAVARFRARQPDALTDTHALRAVPLREHLYGGARATLTLLLGAVGLVLVIACVNLANLMVVRGEARRGELAVRAALGAGRGRLVGGLLTETLVLSAAGGAAGLGVGAGILALVRPVAPAGVPLPTGLPDASVVLVSLAVAVLSGTLFGLVPAWRLARADLRGGLVDGGRGTAAGGSSRLRGALVVIEVAMTAVLLVASGLMLHSLWRLQAVDPGFTAEGRATVSLAPTPDRYPDAPALNRFQRTLVERLTRHPSVAAAGMGQFIPLTGASNWGFEVEGREDEGVGFADYTLITPGYLDAMDQRVVRGRDVRWSDADDDAVPVVLISESMAERLWPGADPLGRRINVDTDGRVWRQVVGVVSDVRNRGLAEEPGDLLYFPPTDLPMSSPRNMSLVVHAPDGAPPMAEIRSAVAALDPAVPVPAARSLQDVLRHSESRRLFMITLLALFAGVALALAAVGLYGVVSYTFSLRTREIGLRMAIGAGRGSVLAMVLRQSGALVGAGLVVGLGAAAALSSLLDSVLYGVGGFDAATYGAVALFLALVAAAATWVPATRATSVDPARVLRE